MSVFKFGVELENLLSWVHIQFPIRRGRWLAVYSGSTMCSAGPWFRFWPMVTSGSFPHSAPAACLSLLSYQNKDKKPKDVLRNCIKHAWCLNYCQQAWIAQTAQCRLVLWPALVEGLCMVFGAIVVRWRHNLQGTVTFGRWPCCPGNATAGMPWHTMPCRKF